MSDKKLNVVLYWHMHQPEYKDIRTGQYHLPWTYLHVIKDYIDMAAHLENNPQARAVVNFTPTLLEQIDDYAQQIDAFLSHDKNIQDSMLDMLVETVLPSSTEERMQIIKHCLRANKERLIDRYKQYQHLAEQAYLLEAQPETIIYLHDQYIIDLLVWFHLAWMGETVKLNDLRIRRLLNKGYGFSIQDRRELLKVIGELCATVIERYKKLHERNQIELSMTPYAHPIMPLLFDINSAREAVTDLPLPHCKYYPDGDERVDWHIEKGMQVFEHYFGFRPIGCWPSEGSVSETTIQRLAQRGIRWLASGETVLHNSLEHHTKTDMECIHQPYQLAGANTHCFFRDDGLSDLIGFTYADWHADDAVANMIHHLENIADACNTKDNSIVSIILDGENAWEYYPENGVHFLDTLYQQLSKHPRINLTTYSDYIMEYEETEELPRIVAGSWVYGTFTTWIGSEDKNKGWDMLCDAKRCVDETLASTNFSPEQYEQIMMQLAICEGSDWFWWFGDYNPAESVRDFEYLYRLQLSHLYILLGKTPPAYLSESFTHGGGQPSAGGTMRRGQEH